MQFITLAMALSLSSVTFGAAIGATAVTAAEFEARGLEKSAFFDHRQRIRMLITKHQTRRWSPLYVY
jgi:hypothetical protein